MVISINWSWEAKHEWKMLFYLKAANSYIDLTAALVWTVEHLEHPVSVNDWASPVSLWPDTAKTDAAHLVCNNKGTISVGLPPLLSSWSTYLLRLRCSSLSLPSSRASTLGCSSCLSLKPAEKQNEHKMTHAVVCWIKMSSLGGSFNANKIVHKTGGWKEMYWQLLTTWNKSLVVVLLVVLFGHIHTGSCPWADWSFHS